MRHILDYTKEELEGMSDDEVDEIATKSPVDMLPKYTAPRVVTIHRKLVDWVMEYWYTEGNALWGYDLAVVTHLSTTDKQVLDLLNSPKKEDRVKASKMYSRLIEE